MKRTSKSDEYLFLRDWILEITRFLYNIAVKENEELASYFLSEFTGRTEIAYNRRNLRGLKCIFNDINDDANDLDEINKNSLNEILNGKFGFGLEYFNGKTLSKIKSITKRGRIENVDEYRLVSERVERIYADDKKKEELDALNSLLADFESKHKPIND